MEWWNDIKMLCARYLVASEQISRSGPVEMAVRAAGYVSEEEGSMDGSSIEESDEEQMGQGLPMRRYSLHDVEMPVQYSHSSPEINAAGYVSPFPPVRLSASFGLTGF